MKFIKYLVIFALSASCINEIEPKKILDELKPKKIIHVEPTKPADSVHAMLDQDVSYSIKRFENDEVICYVLRNKRMSCFKKDECSLSGKKR